jgi:hypothetical protein
MICATACRRASARLIDGIRRTTSNGADVMCGDVSGEQRTRAAIAQPMGVGEPSSDVRRCCNDARSTRDRVLRSRSTRDRVRGDSRRTNVKEDYGDRDVTLRTAARRKRR